MENYKDLNSISREEQEKTNIFCIINEDLGALKTDVLSNDIEDLSTYSLEELYNKSKELEDENRNIVGSINKIRFKIDGLKVYLNMNLAENEETETKEKIEKYEKELELINNKPNQNKKTLVAIKNEIVRRLNQESTYSELNNRFIKIFNFVQFQNDGKNNEGLSNRIIATVIEKDGEEIGKEIRINKRGEYWLCLFRDNDGKFHEIKKNGDNMKNEEQDIGEIIDLESVYNFLRNTSDQNQIEHNGESSEIEKDMIENADFYGLPEEIVHEYISKIKKYGKIMRNLDENLKKNLGLDSVESKISIQDGCVLFYVRKLCPNRFREIIPLILNMMHSNMFIAMQYGILKKTIGSIKSYGDAVYEYLKFSSPFFGSYMKEGISHMQGKYFGETLEQMRQRKEKEGISDVDMKMETIRYQDEMSNSSMLIQYFENFGLEPESINLFSFLKENPQTLENLGGKEIKSINLSMDSGINFAFRGIIEMVKSRHDIEFPHLNENATDLEKEKWKQKREKIVKEYESILRNYIAKDNTENKNGKIFDKVFFTVSHDTHDDVIMPDKNRVAQFGTETIDYSVKYEENTEENNREMSIKMLSDIEKYANDHPNEKILICINQHGSPNGSSHNGWTKENRIRLASISPNIKIWSIRCYFGTAYDNESIYNRKSSVSGFSNKTPTQVTITEIIDEASRKNLGFHEMEIYTRLHYPISVSPLTESMEYIDWNIGEQRIGKIGLAQNETIGDEIQHIDYT